MEDQKKTWIEVDKYLTAIRQTFSLRNTMLDKLMINSKDISAAITHTLRNVHDGNIAVQHVLELLLLLYSAGRPSTLCPSSGTSYFLTWSCCGILPVRRNNAKTVILYKRALPEANKLLFDLGSAVVAHGLPCGAFGKRKLEDLYASRACRIPVESGWEDQPILLASRPKGYGYQPGKPLKSSGLSARFVETLRAINIVAGPNEILEPSSVCRGTLTVWAQRFGETHAQMMGGHNSGSTTLHTNYDQTRRCLDVAGPRRPKQQEVLDAVGEYLDSDSLGCT